MSNIVYCPTQNREISAGEAEKLPEPHMLDYRCPHCGAEMTLILSGPTHRAYFRGSHAPSCILSRVGEISDPERVELLKGLDFKRFLEAPKARTSDSSSGGSGHGMSPAPYRKSLAKQYVLLKDSPLDLKVGAYKRCVAELLYDNRSEQYPRPTNRSYIMMAEMSLAEKYFDKSALTLTFHLRRGAGTTTFILDFKPAPNPLSRGSLSEQAYQKRALRNATDLYRKKCKEISALKKRYKFEAEEAVKAGNKPNTKTVVTVCLGNWWWDPKRNAWVTRISQEKQMFIF